MLTGLGQHPERAVLLCFLAVQAHMGPEDSFIVLSKKNCPFEALL